jgi:hypothetical protein
MILLSYFARVVRNCALRREDFVWATLSTPLEAGLPRQKGFIVCVCPTPAMRARRGGRVCGPAAAKLARAKTGLPARLPCR